MTYLEEAWKELKNLEEDFDEEPQIINKASDDNLRFDKERYLEKVKKAQELQRKIDRFTEDIIKQVKEQFSENVISGTYYYDSVHPGDNYLPVQLHFDLKNADDNKEIIQLVTEQVGEENMTDYPFITAKNTVELNNRKEGDPGILVFRYTLYPKDFRN